MTTTQRYLISSAVTFAGALLFLLLNLVFRQDAFWSEWQIAPDVLDLYCERIRMNSFFREPVNSWSNLIYLFFGVQTFLIMKSQPTVAQPKHLFQFEPRFGHMITGIFLYLFFASTFFHASLTTIGLTCDMTGVYALVFLPYLLVSYRQLVYRKRKLKYQTWTGRGLSLLYVVIATASAYFANDIPTRYFLPVLIIAFFLILIWQEKHYAIRSQQGIFIASFLLILASGVIWFLDYLKVICYPNSIFQGHALWHILNASSVYLLFQFFRSEQSDQYIRNSADTTNFE